MKRSRRSTMKVGIFYALAGLVFLILASLSFADASDGTKGTVLAGVIIFLLVGLFWLVGGFLMGRSMLRSKQSPAEKVVMIMFIVITVPLQVSVFLTPAGSQVHALLYWARDLMLAGLLAVYFSVLYLCRSRVISDPVND